MVHTSNVVHQNGAQLKRGIPAHPGYPSICAPQGRTQDILRDFGPGKKAMSKARSPKILSFQDLILKLQQFWAKRGCVIMQPYDMAMGAGTFHPATFLRAIGPESWSAAYVQPSRRPTAGRYGDNPFRLQHYYQSQVAQPMSRMSAGSFLLSILKPTLCIESSQETWSNTKNSFSGPKYAASATPVDLR